jgi:hypothetical protein
MGIFHPSSLQHFFIKHNSVSGILLVFWGLEYRKESHSSPLALAIQHGNRHIKLAALMIQGDVLLKACTGGDI